MNKISKWEIFSWSMGFVGTGIGAGILFLPVQAGLGGIICFLVASLIGFTISYISHKVFAKLVIDSAEPKDFPQIVQTHLGNTFSIIITVLFFLLSVSYLSVYTIGFNVGLSSYLKALQLITCNLSNTWWFPLLILLVLVSIVSLNERIIAKIMGLVTFPLILLLLCLSFYMIQYWNFDYIRNIPSVKEFSVKFFSNIPILIFAVMFFPPITAMVLSYRKSLRDREKTGFYSYKTLFIGQILLLVFTVFFTLSCLFSTPIKALQHAAATNLNIMAILSYVHHSKILIFVAPLIAIIALLTSFLGYYFGAKESAKNLILIFARIKIKNPTQKDIPRVTEKKSIIFAINITLGIYLYITAIINFNVGIFLGFICSPIIALLLYITPAVIFTRSKKYKYYRGFVYYTIIAGGILILFAAPIAMLIKKL